MVRNFGTGLVNLHIKRKEKNPCLFWQSGIFARFSHCNSSLLSPLADHEINARVLPHRLRQHRACSSSSGTDGRERLLGRWHRVELRRWRFLLARPSLDVSVFAILQRYFVSRVCFSFTLILKNDKIQQPFFHQHIGTERKHLLSGWANRSRVPCKRNARADCTMGARIST